LDRLRQLHRVSIILSVLLLSNSSLALEILTHDAHQHGGAISQQHEMHDVHGMDSEMSHASEAVHGSDDCICDDICCVSSIDFGLGNGEHEPPAANAGLSLAPNFYRSIAIELLLPPPTL